MGYNYCYKVALMAKPFFVPECKYTMKSVAEHFNMRINTFGQERSFLAYFSSP